MKSALFCVLGALVVFCSGLPSVVRYNIEKEPARSKVSLQSYSFKNCLPVAQETIVINSLSFLPDPLVFPGPLKVGFSVNFKDDVSAPLKANVYLARKVGSVWAKIPCIRGIGSCSYTDVCQLLAGISQCPDPFVSAGVPCQCPFKKNTYTLPTTSFDVDSAIFPSGDYQGQANLTINNNIVGCYEITASFA